MPITHADHDLRYGVAHRRRRRALAGLVAAGRAVCSRCGRLIRPGEPWDVSHVDGGGPFDYDGVQHASCNRATGRHRLEREQRRVSRDW